MPFACSLFDRLQLRLNLFCSVLHLHASIPRQNTRAFLLFSPLSQNTTGFASSFRFTFKEFLCENFQNLEHFHFAAINYVKAYNSSLVLYLLTYAFDFKFQECSLHILVLKNTVFRLPIVSKATFLRGFGSFSLPTYCKVIHVFLE